MEKLKKQVFLINENTGKVFVKAGSDHMPQMDYPGQVILFDGSWETFDCQSTPSNESTNSATFSAIEQALKLSTGRSYSCIHLFVASDKIKNAMKLSLRMVLDETLVKTLSNLLAEPNISIVGALHNTKFCISDLELQATNYVENIDGGTEFIQDMNGYESATNFSFKYSVALEWVELKMPVRKERSTVLDTLFNEKLLSDCYLVTDDGVEVGCHKNILAANSASFRELVTNLNQSNKIDMGKISGPVVNLFVAYAYGQDINFEEMTEDIAFELLRAAHKYNISSLEKLVVATLFNRPDNTFTINIVLAVYIFTVDVEGLDDLCKKMINILKRNPKELLSSEAYKELMTKDPKGSAELALKLLNLVIN